MLLLLKTCINSPTQGKSKGLMMPYKFLCDDLAPLTFLTSFLTTLALADPTPATRVSLQFLNQACLLDGPKPRGLCPICSLSLDGFPLVSTANYISTWRLCSNFIFSMRNLRMLFKNGTAHSVLFASSIPNLPIICSTYHLKCPIIYLQRVLSVSLTGR